MDPSLTSLQVVNRALVELARGQPLASGTPSTNFDGSPDGVYAATLYQGAVQMLLRQQDYEFARRTMTLVASGHSAPLGWAYEYVYPTDCIKVRQVFPPGYNANDPQPIRWDVGFNPVGPLVVIWASLANAQICYTTNDVTEGDWDDGFTEIMVRYMGSMLSLPVAGRPDFSQVMLETAGKMVGGFVNKDS